MVGGKARVAFASLLLIAPNLSASCLAAAPDVCRAEPQETVMVSLRGTEPVYSRVFSGTIEAVAPADELRPGSMSVRLEDTDRTETIYYRYPQAGFRFPVGMRAQFQVDHAAGFPSLYGILISDDRGLVFAAASDLQPGNGVLRGGVPGFEIEFTESPCAPRARGGCYEEITNLPLKITHGNSSVVLMQGQSAEIDGYRVHCLAAQRVVYSDRCADAGVITLSYVIVRSDLLGKEE